jgi:hypothetical protein
MRVASHWTGQAALLGPCAEGLLHQYFGTCFMRMYDLLSGAGQQDSQHRAGQCASATLALQSNALQLRAGSCKRNTWYMTLPTA